MLYCVSESISCPQARHFNAQILVFIQINPYMLPYVAFASIIFQNNVVIPTHRHSTSELDTEEISDWTLGESIIRILSQRDITLFNFEDPQSQRLEAMAVWTIDKLATNIIKMGVRICEGLVWISEGPLHLQIAMRIPH